MTYAPTAVLQRLREVLEYEEGASRAIPIGRLQGQLPPGLDPAGEAKRTIGQPRYEITISEHEPHEATPISTVGSVQIISVGIEIRVLYQVPTAAGDDSQRDAARALAADDARLIRWALTSTNLRTTDAGVDTGIISGSFRWLGDGLVDVRFADGERRLEWLHRYSAVVKDTAPT